MVSLITRNLGESERRGGVSSITSQFPFATSNLWGLLGKDSPVSKPLIPEHSPSSITQAASTLGTGKGRLQAFFMLSQERWVRVFQPSSLAFKEPFHYTTKPSLGCSDLRHWATERPAVSSPAPRTDGVESGEDTSRQLPRPPSPQ